MSDTTNFFTKCTPAIRANVDTTGSLTVCNLDIPVPADLDTLYKNSSSYRIMEAQFFHDMELKACQARQHSLYDYLMATKVDMSKKLTPMQVATGLYKIMPYFYAKRKGPINNAYWLADTGVPCSADGTQPGDSTCWRLDFSSPTNIPVDVRWFNPKEKVFIKGVTGGGTGTDTAYQVISASVVSTKVRAVLLPLNSQSFLPAARVTAPVKGIAVRGTANVSDFESFCARGPGLLTTTQDEFWIGTTRDAQAVNSRYEEWRDLVFAHNPLYRELFDLPLIEYNKQSGDDFQRRFVNTAFFSKARPSQTVATVTSLEQISSIGPTTGSIIGPSAECEGYRADPIGFYEQMAQCQRIADAQGQQLYLPSILKAIYKMKNIREDTGAPGESADVFEIGVPSTYSVQFQQAILRYFKDRSEGMLRLNLDLSSKLQQSPFGFKYREYQMDWPNVRIKLIEDRFFDDWKNVCILAGDASHFNDASYAKLGNRLWIMNWSRIYLGMMGSDRVVNETGDIKTLAQVDPAYLCVMKTPSKKVTMTSMTWSAIVECPAENLIIENFSDDVPNHTDDGADYEANT